MKAKQQRSDVKVLQKEVRIVQEETVQRERERETEAMLLDREEEEKRIREEVLCVLCMKNGFMKTGKINKY